MDVFSFAGIILHMFNQCWPRPTESNHFDPKTRRKVALLEVERRQQYLDKIIGEAEALRPLVEECLDDDPALRPMIAAVCERIQVSKDATMKECPQDVITIHQQNKQLKAENLLLRSENEQQKLSMEQLVIKVIIIISVILFGIVFLVLHKEYTNTTSSQST